jgi:uncharacterized membrane protein YfcA
VPGVVVLGSGLPLLAAVLDALLGDGLSWLFGVALVLSTAYCAWEARPEAARAVMVTPPLVTLFAALVATLLDEGWTGALTFPMNVFRVLAGQVAPMLLLAEVVAAALVWWRRRSPAAKPAQRPTDRQP